MDLNEFATQFRMHRGFPDSLVSVRLSTIHLDVAGDLRPNQ